MSAANFRTMPDFPLCVLDNAAMPVCPVCGELFETEEAETCPACGYTGEPELRPAPFEDEYRANELSALADSFSESLTFFTVSVRPGYYFGLQFYVEEAEDSPEDLDNEDCRYLWDLCRSAAIRKREREKNKVRRWLQKAAAEHGMETLVCVGRFSNGEALYRRAEEPAARLRAVVCGPKQFIPAGAGQTA